MPQWGFQLELERQQALDLRIACVQRLARWRRQVDDAVAVAAHILVEIRQAFSGRAEDLDVNAAKENAEEALSQVETVVARADVVVAEAHGRAAQDSSSASAIACSNAPSGSVRSRTWTMSTPPRMAASRKSLKLGRTGVTR